MKKVSVILSLAAFAASSNAQFLGPTAYLQTSDSPWQPAGFEYFQRDTFESGAQTATGVTASVGSVIGFGQFGTNVDSVDGDDGVVDGNGNKGRSWFIGSGAVGVTWTFNATILGKLPSHAGIVWTDGGGLITFEAWDENGVSLGTRTGNHADALTTGGTAEDRFYGAINAGGISKIKLSNSGGGIEMDHLQFGFGPVPEPASFIAMGAGLLLLRRRKRSQ